MKKVQKRVERIRFKGISAHAWEHPADRMALKALRKLKGMDELVKFFMGGTIERSLHLINLASSIRVTPKQFKKVHKLHLEACAILDLEQIPDLFVSQNPIFNAGAVGVDKPFIVLNSALLDSFSEDELLTVIGHELAHIKSGHVLYKTLLLVLLKLSTLLVNIPLTGLVLKSITLGLMEWSRKSELSCDRAGLLTVQDSDVPIKLLMKMAGGSQIKQMDLGSFIAQAEEYNRSDSMSDNIHKILNTINQSHPFHILRVSELLKWVQSGDYDYILRGFYNTSSQEKDFKSDFEEAKNDYWEDIQDNLQPLKNIFKGIVKDK